MWWRDLATVTGQDLLQSVERQAIGILGNHQPDQQFNRSDALADRMGRTLSALQAALAIIVQEDSFLLHDLDDLHLGGDNIELFLDLTKKV